MGRFSAKTDANQKEIVKVFRSLGATVAVTSKAGKGFPDLVVGVRGINYLVEVKDGSKTPSQRKLTPDQVIFHGEWKGQICIVETVDDAVALLSYYS